MYSSEMMLLVRSMIFGVQVSAELWARDCMSEDMLRRNGRGSGNSWSDSLVNSCSGINQIAAARLFEDGTTKKLSPAPSGGLKVETFMEEKMNLTISSQYTKGERI